MTRAIERLWHRLQLVLGRGRVTLVDDSKTAQTMQVRLGQDETKDDIPRIAEYGFVSNPPVGSDALVLFIAGERTNGVVVATNNQRVRMTGLATGEVAIHDDKGRFVLLGAGGIHVQGNADPIVAQTTSDITATAGGSIALNAGVKIKLAAPQVEIDATVLTVNAQTVVNGVTALNGNTGVTGALTNNGQDVGSGHGHLPGTYRAGTTPLTGQSGTPT